MRNATSCLRLAIPLLLSLALPAAVRAQPAAPADSAVIRTRGAAFALSVADIEASTRWYAEKLGLTVIMRVPRTEETRAQVTVLRGGGLLVELIQHDDAKPLGSVLPPGRGALYLHGVFKVGVFVDDFDATLAALRARGVEVAIGPFPKRPDQPANVIIRDNAGNLIQIVGP